ncbi:MAG: tetraacyldisaccharide 4'-kinase [Desulfuromonadales bacterium C00003068]|nr:MAG: tetraacyldisaccharide 4'-kinase [Desulfuromonadales bacterium C00003068]
MYTRLALYYRRLATRGARSNGDRLLLAILVPIGWLYGCINLVRAKLYQAGVFSCYKASVPVISVGNLAVGGTGKTPMVDYLLKQQRAQQRKVAVISRGYGGEKGDAVRVVCAGNGPIISATQCGDEPYLLARRNPQAIVIVAPQRSAGIDTAIKTFGVDLIVLDDAFQHLAVARDLDLLLFDSRYPFGNGHLLPAGLLREFPAAVQRADLCIMTRYNQQTAIPLACVQPIIRAQQSLAHSAQDLLGHDYPVEQLRQSKCVAFAGIANPHDFFTSLEQSGVRLLATLPLADHCEFTPHVIESIKIMAAEADFILTTEKDAVKLNNEMFNIPCCSFSLIFDPIEADLLEQKINSLFN